MDAMDAMTMRPGRYQVRGGPRGEYAVCRVTRKHGTGGRGSYTDRWPVLASLRVPAGASVTQPGMLAAVGRVWGYGR